MQIARIASQGVIRPITRGEVLIEGGQTDVPFFVLRAGAIEVVRPSGLGDLLIAVLGPSQFTGDISMILDRPAQARLSVSESGEVVQLTRDQMHALIQTDAEVSEVLMRALIHRRVAMVAQGIGDVLLIGSAHSAATLRIKEFLTRNGHPFKYLDLDRDAEVRTLLDRFHVDEGDIPVVICRGEAVLKNPSNQQIANRLGFNDRIDQAHLRDVVVVGAGPAGLRRPFTRRPKASMRWSSRPARLEARRARARRLRTTSGFQPGFQAGTWPGAPTPRRRSLAPRS
jgi:thioredoxin reductase (NADPH)